MSEINYRQIIQETLPRLALDIAHLIKDIGRGVDYRTTTQSAWRSQADLSKPFHLQTEQAAKGYEYIFSPRRKSDAPNYGRTGPIAHECQIKFRNLRVTDIIDRQYGELDQSVSGSPVVTTREYPNDGPHEFDQTLEFSDEAWTEWGTNWGLAVETELEQTIKAGSELYGIESETRFKISASAETGGEKSGGQKRTESESKTIPISPYSILQVTTTRQPVQISQQVIVTGTLDFEVDIVLMHMWGENCQNFEALLNVVRGIGAKNDRIRSWFSNPAHTIPETVLKAIERPLVTIDVGLQGVPGESITQSNKEIPISGTGEKNE